MIVLSTDNVTENGWNDGAVEALYENGRDTSRDIRVQSIIQLNGNATSVMSAAPHEIARLVGSMPLKAITAHAAIAIEKDCIVTALDRTRGNRAAAAQLLGISRQTLYAKLRQFDLLTSKDSN
jgi:transcriptional regulator of acetoin/glycerol metabolism